MAEQSGAGEASQAGNVDRINAYRTYLATAEVHLFTAPFSPTPANVLADFVAAEAAYSGYASTTPTWTAAGYDSEGTYGFTSGDQFFQNTTGASGASIGGFWLQTAAGVLQGYGVFTDPIPMNAALAYLSLLLTVTGTPYGGTYDVVY